MKTALHWALGNLIVGVAAFGVFILALLYTEEWEYRVEVLPFLLSGGAAVGFLYWLIVAICVQKPKLTSEVIVPLAMGQFGMVIVAVLLLFVLVTVFGG